MQALQDSCLKIVATINGYLTDYVLIFLLVGIGLFFTIRTRFVQVRCFREGWRLLFAKNEGGKIKGLSSFEALTTAVAAQVGTGNIVGACGAILIGGPGAIFWMWLIAFFGMATIYAEATVAQRTREREADGSVKGGPIYYIKAAFSNRFGKFLAVFFAVASVLALGFMGAMVQSNSIGLTAKTAFGIPSWVMGVVVAVLVGLVLLGGIRRIGEVSARLVPLMAILYLLGGFVVLACRITYLPETVGMIFRYAFVPQALLGGGFGAAIKSAISQGAKRGLFSNEAGMGSTPHAHALSEVKDPHEQGAMAMIGVFIDTFLVLTMTALVVISTLYAGNGPLSTGSTEGFSSDNLAQEAFGTVFGTGFGSIFVAVCLFFFAFSTIVSWNLFGRINFEYLFGKRYTHVYTAISLVFVVLGSFLGNDLVWGLTDMFNQLMVLPNAAALLCFGGFVGALARRKKQALGRELDSTR